MLFLFWIGFVHAQDHSSAELDKFIKYSPTETNKVGYIKITDRTSGISQSTWLYVKKALEYYTKESRPIFVILELDTPGGEVFAAQKISDALRDLDINDGIPVVAFINNWAISAGAMLAYSCRIIAVTKYAAMGAAEPVIASQTGEMKEASEKVNSALRTDFANRASFFDRNPYIAEAMVDKDMILVFRDGKITKLASESQVRNEDTVISAKGKLLTLNSEQMMQYGVANILLPPAKLETISEEEKNSGKWPAKKMLLFEDPFFAKIPNAVIDEYHLDWKTNFFVLLATPAVSSLLMLGLMMGFYIEMNTPGFGVAGSIAVLCLILIVLSYLSLEIANWLEVIFMLIGLTIIAVDLLVLPTFGILGIFGVLFFLGGLFGILLPELSATKFDIDTQTLNAAGEALLERLVWFGTTFLIGVILIMIMARFLTPKIAAWSRLVLKGGEQDASKGYYAGELMENLPKVGTTGVVFSTLRPAGKIMIDNKIYDAMTSGSFIEKGSKITVTHLEGSVIYVDKEGSS